MLYDIAGVFPADARRATNETLLGLAEAGRIELFVYTQVKPSATTVDDARADAEQLLSEWGLGGGDSIAAAVMWEFDRGLEGAVIGTAASAGLSARGLDGDALQAIVDGSVADDLAQARALAYEGVAAVDLRGAHSRTDIGLRAERGEVSLGD